MSSSVLDASALLALLQQEPGSQQVATAVTQGAAMSAVNLSEVVAKLSEAGLAASAIHAALDPLGLNIVDFDASLAYAAGLLRPVTRAAGLSLGDRACLALAEHLKVPALTTDRSWQTLPVAVTLHKIR